MYLPVLIILLYLGVIALIIYVFYRIIDGWVNRSLDVRREQNALLSRLIDVLEKDRWGVPFPLPTALQTAFPQLEQVAPIYASHHDQLCPAAASKGPILNRMDDVQPT